VKRIETLKLLQAHKAELAEQFSVLKLALFGSTARDTAGPNSDIDILVEFDGRPPLRAISVFSSIWKTCWADQLIW